MICRREALEFAMLGLLAIVGARVSRAAAPLVWITGGADHDGAPFYTLKRGERFDLASWQVQ